MKKFEVKVNGQPIVGLFSSMEAVQTLCVHRDSKVEVREVEACNCEHAVHSPTDDGPDDAHDYYDAPAGDARAQHVGAICDDCVDHMHAFLV